MRRNTSSSLRFFSVMYVYVHSRRKSRAFLVLLASTLFTTAHMRRISALRLRVLCSHTASTLPATVLVRLELLASTPFTTAHMRRNTSSSLRFFSVMYVYVHSRRKSRAFLVLLASTLFTTAYILRMPRLSIDGTA